MQNNEPEFSFKSLFVPLTTFKAIHIIVILGVVVFGNALFNGFVWDDISYIVNYPIVHSFDLSALLGKNLWNTGLTYKPLQPFYFGILYGVFRDLAFFYHLFQVVMHITATSLFFVFLEKYFKSIIALFLSLLFLVHPIQVEAVSYIAASGAQLFFIFGISALLLSTIDIISTKRLVTIFGLLLLSIFSREEGLLFLLIVMFYRIIFHRKRIAAFLTGSILTFLVYLVIRSATIGLSFGKLKFVNVPNLSLTEKFLNLPAIFFYYLKTLFYPAHLAIDQWWTTSNVDFISFYFPLIVNLLFFSLLLFFGVYLYIRKKPRVTVYLFFFLWFAFGLLMHSQLVPVGNTVADRYFYFTFGGFLGLMGVGVENIKHKTVAKIGYVTAIIILLLLSLRTIIRNTNWYSEITLYGHDVKVMPSYDLEGNLGTAYIKERNYSEALRHYKRSVELHPNELNLYSLAITYQGLRDLPMAKKYYIKAYDAQPNAQSQPRHGPLLYMKFAQFLLMFDDPKKAKEITIAAINDYPDTTQFWILLALIEYKSDHQTQAVAAIEKAESLLPGDITQNLRIQIANEQNIQFSDSEGLGAWLVKSLPSVLP